jgi:hypothetical protein
MLFTFFNELGDPLKKLGATAWQARGKLAHDVKACGTARLPDRFFPEFSWGTSSWSQLGYKTIFASQETSWN